jgi:hypothetical protein
VLRIYGPRRELVKRGWIKLLNKEFHNLYSSPNIIGMIKSRRMRWVGHVVCMGYIRNSCNVSVGKPEGKKPLERTRHR